MNATQVASLGNLPKDEPRLVISFIHHQVPARAEFHFLIPLRDVFDSSHIPTHQFRGRGQLFRNNHRWLVFWSFALVPRKAPGHPTVGLVLRTEVGITPYAALPLSPFLQPGISSPGYWDPTSLAPFLIATGMPKAPLARSAGSVSTSLSKYRAYMHVTG